MSEPIVDEEQLNDSQIIQYFDDYCSKNASIVIQKLSNNDTDLSLLSPVSSNNIVLPQLLKPVDDVTLNSESITSVTVVTSDHFPASTDPVTCRPLIDCDVTGRFLEAVTSIQILPPSESRNLSSFYEKTFPVRVVLKKQQKHPAQVNHLKKGVNESDVETCSSRQTEESSMSIFRTNVCRFANANSKVSEKPIFSEANEATPPMIANEKSILETGVNIERILNNEKSVDNGALAMAVEEVGQQRQRRSTYGSTVKKVSLMAKRLVDIDWRAKRNSKTETAKTKENLSVARGVRKVSNASVGKAPTRRSTNRSAASIRTACVSPTKKKSRDDKERAKPVLSGKRNQRSISKRKSVVEMGKNIETHLLDNSVDKSTTESCQQRPRRSTASSKVGDKNHSKISETKRNSSFGQNVVVATVKTGSHANVVGKVPNRPKIIVAASAVETVLSGRGRRSTAKRKSYNETVEKMHTSGGNAIDVCVAKSATFEENVRRQHRSNYEATLKKVTFFAKGSAYEGGQKNSSKIGANLVSKTKSSSSLRKRNQSDIDRIKFALAFVDTPTDCLLPETSSAVQEDVSVEKTTEPIRSKLTRNKTKLPNDVILGTKRKRLPIRHYGDFDFDDESPTEKKTTKSKTKKLEKHSPIRPFVCKSCGESFAYKHNLTDHESIHSNERPFVCSFCQKAFRLKGLLKSHLLHRHAEEAKNEINRLFHSATTEEAAQSKRPFRCEICGKQFSSKQNLKFHGMEHTDDLPVKCGCCKEAFRLNRHLKHHMFKEHSREAQEILADKNLDRPFSCETCDKAFRSKQNVDRHRRIHTGERPYACRMCKETFRMKDLLKYHILNRHVEEAAHEIELLRPPDRPSKKSAKNRTDFVKRLP